jgi:hypothetical protein
MAVLIEAAELKPLSVTASLIRLVRSSVNRRLSCAMYPLLGSWTERISDTAAKFGSDGGCGLGHSFALDAVRTGSHHCASRYPRPTPSIARSAF